MAPTNNVEMSNIKADVEKLEHRTSVASFTQIPTTSDSLSATDEQMNLPLRKAFRQYSRLCWYVLGMTTVVLLWGYDGIIVGNITAIPAFQRDFGGVWSEQEQEYIIPAFWLSLLSAIPDVGRGFGATTAGPLQDKIGRIKTLFIGATIATVSILVMFFSNKGPSMDGKRGLLLFARLLQGYGLGMIKIQALTYISETVPTCLRGPSMALFPAFDLLGKLTGALVIFGVESIDSDTSYLIAIGSQWIFSICPLILCFFLPESPAYYVRRKNMDAAKASLKRLYAPKNDPEIAFEKLRLSIEHEEAVGSVASYADCFRGTNRRRTLVIMFANFLPPMFGLPLLSSISYFLQQTGMNSSKSIIFLIIGIVCGLLANIGSSWTLSHIKRRRLTIVTLGGASLLWGAMGISGIKQNDNITPWLTAAFGILTIICCGLGCWPGSYAIMSEASALRLRAKSQAIGGITAYIVGIFTQFVLPYLYNPDAANLKAKTGFVFAGTSLLAGVITWLVVPEMKGRSVMEIDRLFEDGVRARGSGKWRVGEGDGEVRRAAL
ncbi:Nn.00g113910.m01.CDS01 [Neocucurbitaria sp. VM-36]